MQKPGPLIPAIFDKINYHAALDLLSIAEQNQIEKIVITSTGGVLGHSEQGKLVDEASRAKPETMTQYERSKAKLEKAVEQKVKEGMPAILVNPARVFGPGPLIDSNGEVVVMHRYLQGGLRFLPGDGSSTGSYVFLDDVVNGHILAMDKGRPGERYILGGENASFREFFDTIAKVAGKKYRMYPVPVPFLMGFARLQLFLAENFGRYPLITPELVRKYTKRWDFSSKKAQEELGYSFISMEEGVSRTLDWLKKEGMG
jgi:nucleoside-diphosphate-sugar epimerase